MPCKPQAKVELDEPGRLWHYIGKPSTDSKAQYTDDPSNPVHNPQSDFLDALAKSTSLVPPPPSQAPQPAMLPPKRPPANATPVPVPVHVFALPLSSFPPNTFQQPSGQTAGQTAAQPGAQPPAEPRRSYSVIKPPYVPHTSPTTTAFPAPPLSASPLEVAASNFRKSSDGFVHPQRPASHRRDRRSSSSSRRPFGSFFSMPKTGGGNSKFPQIQHPNLSHGYATVPTAKPHSSSASTEMSPPGSNLKSEPGSEARTPALSPPEHTIQQTPTSQKYSFFQVHGNADASTYRSPYLENGGFSRSIEKRRNSIVSAPSRSRKSSSGAVSLAAAAAKLHKRSASSMSSVTSFGLGGGLRGLGRPSPHTNYVGAPPPASSTSSSPFLSANNMTFNTRPGSSVSSYASYDNMMGGMSPHSPASVDASPFIGSPGPQMGAFDYSVSSSAGYHHPGMRPQFGASWQQNFHASMGSFSQGE